MRQHLQSAIKVHLFRLSEGGQSFAVRVSDGQQELGAWLTVSPDGDFAGVTVQSGRKGAIRCAWTAILRDRKGAWQ